MRDRHQLIADSLPESMKDVQVSGVITIILQLCLCLENLLPILLHACWRRPGERTLSDKLVAALCATYVLSAVVPSPLALASYFNGSWYGGAATCECFQVKL
ncbi:hypothetical protein C0Q70_09263 [Pomacea canaliculata]|uniref:G-protein coupled receptors family 1 profile domain-containing protein n=1 Tax=Pomacea canaliculata TaxID=400727 RepID=A0A2T7P9A4_POMCA|nr:hypothetical protein C0Q70_09263 [Pomacea canaliculata]